MGFHPTNTKDAFKDNIEHYIDKCCAVSIAITTDNKFNANGFTNGRIIIWNINKKKSRQNYEDIQSL